MMKKIAWVWLAIAIVIGGFISLFASAYPDGYETAGEKTGFIEHATTFLKSPFPDYSIPGVSGIISSSFAGIIGVILVFVVFLLIGKLITKKQ